MVAKKQKAFVKKQRFFSSFYYASNGVRIAFLREKNIRVFFIISILVLLAGYVLNISTIEWIVLMMLIGVNFMAELYNTAVEVLCDKVSPRKNVQIANAKDISAAAVLVLSLVSAIIGIVMFLPKIIALF